MPFALSFIGILLIVVGFQNTYAEFGRQVAKDFTGEGNFLYWIAAISLVGAVGYIKSAEGFSRAFMVLIIIGIILSQKGFFAKLQEGIKTGTAKENTVIGVPLPGGASGSSGGSASEGGGFGWGDAIKIGAALLF